MAQHVLDWRWVSRISLGIGAAVNIADALGSTGDPRFSVAQRASNWISIPAGRFWMGTQGDDPTGQNYDYDAIPDEHPVREVYLDAYQIGRYLVTVQEFEEFMDAEGYRDASHWDAGGFEKHWRYGDNSRPKSWGEQVQYRNRPVVGVSWHEAAAYAHWVRGRLPTEAEWERASRGTEGRKYPWGDARPSYALANYDRHIRHPTPVGVYPQGATPEGICDLAGNVSEWCSDWYGEYSSADVVNPRGPIEGVAKVIRGGCFASVAGDGEFCRGAWRWRTEPSTRSYTIGFRVVRSLNV